MDIGLVVGLLVVWGVIFCLPYIVGWRILRSKKPGRTAWNIIAALILMTIYWCGTAFLRFVQSDDYPPYTMVNEAFMFSVEQKFGLEKFYRQSRKFLQERQKDQDSRIKVEIPRLPYMLYNITSDGHNLVFFFFRHREEGRRPLHLEIKTAEEAFLFGAPGEEEFCSLWNENTRIHIDGSRWKHRVGFAWNPFRVLLLLFCSLCWIFPLAAAASRLRSSWAFYGLWIVILALYCMNFRECLENVPAWQYSRRNPQQAVAELSKPENRDALQKLLRMPTSIKDKDSGETVIGVPLLCGGDFFAVKFLCWDLGRSNYLYYSPTDLRQAKFLTANADISVPAKDFYLASYPEYANFCNSVCYQFAAIQTIAGLLWLTMFLTASKKRRKEERQSEPAAK